MNEFLVISLFVGWPDSLLIDESAGKSLSFTDVHFAIRSPIVFILTAYNETL